MEESKFIHLLEKVIVLSEFLKEPRNIFDICEHLNVSERTSYRIIQELEKTGFCITNKHRTYQIIDVKLGLYEKAQTLIVNLNYHLES